MIFFQLVKSLRLYTHRLSSLKEDHHVEDVLALFRKFYAMLHEDGRLALVDWDKEAGFSNLNIETVSVAKKPYGEYPIFLLTAQKLTYKG